MILGYIEDGPNLVTLAMNGWADGEPVWWLNLQAHPGARVDLADGPCVVRARAAEGEERSRLWARWREIDTKLDAYAALRSSETAVVILEPQAPPPRSWLLSGPSAACTFRCLTGQFFVVGTSRGCGQYGRGRVRVRAAPGRR